MPNMLLLAGTGRDSGKTLYGCSILRHFGRGHAIHSLKITPHFHKGTSGGKIIAEDQHFSIIEELVAGSDKDSKRFLGAGAQRSFFITSQDDHLGQALDVLFERVPEGLLWICESGGARKWIEPGLFLMISEAGATAPKAETQESLKLADRLVLRDDSNYDFSVESIRIVENRWALI